MVSKNITLTSCILGVVGAVCAQGAGVGVPAGREHGAGGGPGLRGGGGDAGGARCATAQGLGSAGDCGTPLAPPPRTDAQRGQRWGSQPYRKGY